MSSSCRALPSSKGVSLEGAIPQRFTPIFCITKRSVSGGASLLSSPKIGASSSATPGIFLGLTLDLIFLTSETEGGLKPAYLVYLVLLLT